MTEVNNFGVTLMRMENAVYLNYYLDNETSYELYSGSLAEVEKLMGKPFKEIDMYDMMEHGTVED